MCCWRCITLYHRFRGIICSSLFVALIIVKKDIFVSFRCVFLHSFWQPFLSILIHVHILLLPLTACVSNCWHQHQLPLVLLLLRQHLRDVVLSALLLLSITALWNSSDLFVSQPPAAGSCDFFMIRVFMMRYCFISWALCCICKNNWYNPPPKSSF